jgi:imidazolonepropionase-like amidohydrolase
VSHAKIILIAFAGLLLGCSPSADSPKKALVGATLIDGTGAPALADSVIVIENGKITAVGSEASTKVPDGFEKVNVSGKFILPGLIDAHVIVSSDAAKLRAFPAAGVTSIGADEFGAGVEGSPRVFSSQGKRAGIADLVIASNGAVPDATLAKMERMAKAELPPIQIIQAATKNAASWLGQSDLGAIQPGQKADLLILNADPTADMKNLRQVYRVMIDGRWIKTK